MKVLICPDKFKHSLSATDVAKAIESGFRKAVPEAAFDLCPLADGGEGTVDTLINAAGGRKVTASVHGPDFKTVSADYGILENRKTAVIEMAAASGLHLIEEAKRNPLRTSTLGTGELILDAVRKGVRDFIIGIGGSATCDCGMGMACALGWKFLDIKGNEVKPVGGNLDIVESIDGRSAIFEIKESRFRVASDVENPLFGKNGAAFVFGPQKGATREEVLILDRGLEKFARVVERDMGIDVSKMRGAGAAGGLGAGLAAFLGATLEPGIDIVMDFTNLPERMKRCDFVITGEGKIDYHTFSGKTISGVVKLALKEKKPVIALAGSIDDCHYFLNERGIAAAFSILPGPVPLDNAIRNAYSFTESIARQIAGLIKAMQ